MTQPISDEGLEQWLEAMLMVAQHYRVDCSPENARVAMASLSHREPQRVLPTLATQLGLHGQLQAFSPELLNPWRMPLAVELEGGQIGVLKTIGADGRVALQLAGERGVTTEVSASFLAGRVERVLILRPAQEVPDARVDDYIQPFRKHWFWSIITRDLPRYGNVVVASLVANVLALAAILFSMQVYDRVVPAQSINTLYVLFLGVLLAMVFEFTMRILRVRIIDLLGKRADLQVSDRVFGHALRIRSTHRPRSTGTFIAQLRELENVRELITSTTIASAADMPFFLLFFAILWLLAGPLALVPLAALLLLLVPGLLAQPRLARLSREGMRESSLRNAMLVETVQGAEDIKLMRAEHRFQGHWNGLNEATSDIGLRQRFLTQLLTTWTQQVQNLVFATVVFFGAFQVMAGNITVGVLVAASILSSRMMSPMAQLSMVLTRWQSAKVALEGLDSLMERPVDHPPQNKRVQLPGVQGQYQFKRAAFRYDEEGPSVLAVPQLQITPGERIALLGRNGAGKSTLLQALSGLLPPARGEVALDGLRMSLIDPYDVRRQVGLLSQNAQLFYGTIRENLTLGVPNATDEQLLEVLSMTGALEFVQALPEGLDQILFEGGQGLSGGQRQLLLLARTLMLDPRVLLLDEPTAALDDRTEQQILTGLDQWLAGRTLVVATHKVPLLRLVDRIVVLDAGRVVMDGAREDVLERLGTRHGSA